MRRRLFFEEKNKGLPNSYQEVKYLGSNGTQFITTGFGASTESDSLEYTINIAKNTGPINNRGIFSSYAAGSRGGGLFLKNNGSVCVAIGDGEKFEVAQSLSFQNYHISINGLNKTVTLRVGDGEPSTQSYTGNIANGKSLCLYGTDHENGPGQELSKMKIGRVSAFKNGIQVLDYIPCYLKTDNTVRGFWNVVTGSLITDMSGSSTLLALGPDING